MTNCFHLAGIVPIASRPTGFNLPWDDCLVPIAPNYFPFENAIYQAAMAGCETIWVVCPQETAPLVRKRMGDFICDPTTVGSNMRSLAPDKYRRLIPIYYIPIKIQHEYKSACLPWSIIRGASMAREISASISKWTQPDKYFVAFPYGVYDADEIRPQRRKISTVEDNWCLSYVGKTSKDNVHLSYTFSPIMLDKYIEIFKDYENDLLIDGQDAKKHFTYEVELSIIMEELEEMSENIFELENFSQIDTWKLYRQYLGSDQCETLKVPGKLYLSYSEWNPIAEDLDENVV